MYTYTHTYAHIRTYTNAQHTQKLHTRIPTSLPQIENVLITARGEYKLCDFGSCTTRTRVYASQREIAVEEENIQKYSTPGYRSVLLCVCVCVYVCVSAFVTFTS
jgi:hypothetical protein